MNKNVEFCIVMEKWLIIELCYDGTSYAGWQIQPNAITVQGTIENALKKLNSNVSVNVVGCGRTDSGVHARQYFMHLQWPEKGLPSLKYKLNKMLPCDIKILSCEEKKIHARFDAKRRTYRYFIGKEKDPFGDRYQWSFERKLDINTMNEACGFLIGKQDFASFAKGDSDVKTTICEVFHAHWGETETQYTFEVCADRFLRNMVRAMVGTLIEAGLHNIEPKQIKNILAQKNRQEAALSVPAKGLFLWKVEY